MKISFVCYGNICRSVMAQMMFINKLKENNISNIIVDSFATHEEEIGNSIYKYAKDILIKNNIPIINHKAKKITKNDYINSDLIICFDYNNKSSINEICGDDTKVKLLKEFINSDDIIDDPWYTRDFETCYKEIDICLDELFKTLRK